MTKVELSSNEKDYIVDRIIENIDDVVDRDGNLNSWSRKGLLNIIENAISDINAVRKENNII